MATLGTNFYDRILLAWGEKGTALYEFEISVYFTSRRGVRSEDEERGGSVHTKISACSYMQPMLSVMGKCIFTLGFKISY